MKSIPLLASLAAACLHLAAAAPEPPNILFLLTDDQSFQTVRAFGHLDIDTPHLDRLARRGTTFTHAYNMGSWTPAVCVASRTMLLTGRSLWRAQALHTQADEERRAGRLWPQLLARAGYTTCLTGKWHVNADATAAFDQVRNLRPGMPGDTPAAYGRPVPGHPDPWNPADPALGGYWAGGKHWSEVVADDVVEFLHSPRPSGQPFFLYAAFNAPHDPRQSPQSFLDAYPLSRISLPANFLPAYPHQQAIGCGPSLRDEKLAPFPRSQHAVKVHRREYFALITHLDTQIGRILDALDHSGQTHRTWIIFTSDHGLAAGQHGLLGKQNMYDHSLRVPFIVAGPGVPAGATRSSPILLQDAMATTLDLAGAPKPDHLEFHSLLPLLRDPQETKTTPASRETIYAASRETIYAAYLDLQRAVIHEEWKLILYPKAPAMRLYHLAKDPEELRDLAGDPDQAERCRSLFQRLRSLQSNLADPLDLTLAFPNL